jgi:hypothetical protein
MKPIIESEFSYEKARSIPLAKSLSGRAVRAAERPRRDG